jgi:metal-dependent amidase/aminoacylase/carboxypeptidase family protein
MNEIVEKVRRIAEGAALITGAELDFELPDGPNYDMITNRSLARRLKANLDAVGLEMPEAKAEQGSGSTDWGNVSYSVPSVETSYPIFDRVCTWHSQEVVEASDSELGYRNTILVAKALALTGLDLLLDSDALAEVRLEFESSLSAREAVVAS